jgi:hypothetical protein
MIWQDTISDILALINAGSVYNTARSTTPTNLGLSVLNQAKDWLCTYKPWRDLRTTVQLPLDADRKITLPADYGKMIMVYTDPSGIGKPMYWYTLNDNDVARRYTEECTYDAATGHTRKIAFPPTVYVPENPYICYSRVVADYTGTGTEISFFPKNIMLIVAKMILQDFYGVPANQDPEWIKKRVFDELRIFESYAYNNNVALDMSVKDRFGNPVFIGGGSMDGSRTRLNSPSPFLPSTLWSGGTT